jgi:hypothetical protein
MLALLTVSLGVAAPRLIVRLFVVPPTSAVSVAVCAVSTPEMGTENLTVLVPAGTVTEEGTVTAVELLERLTTWPPVGAHALRVTPQLPTAPPVYDGLLQPSLLGTACPVPLSGIVEVVPVEELLVRTSAPVTAPATVGLNSTLK